LKRNLPVTKGREHEEPNSVFFLHEPPAVNSMAWEFLAQKLQPTGEKGKQTEPQPYYLLPLLLINPLSSSS
jgi:hypothetical protein